MARILWIFAVVSTILACLSAYCSAEAPNGLRSLFERAASTQHGVDPKIGDVENLELQPVFMKGQHRSGAASGAASPVEPASGAAAGTSNLAAMQQLLPLLMQLMASATAAPAAAAPSPPPEYG